MKNANDHDAGQVSKGQKLLDSSWKYADGFNSKGKQFSAEKKNSECMPEFSKPFRIDPGPINNEEIISISSKVQSNTEMWDPGQTGGTMFNTKKTDEVGKEENKVSVKAITPNESLEETARNSATKD